MAYQEEFENWSEDTFKITNVNVTRSLGDFPRKNDVFVNKAKSVDMIKSLLEKLKEDDQHIWTQLEIRYRLARGPLHSRLVDSSTDPKDIKTEISGIQSDLQQNKNVKHPEDSPFQQILFEQNMPSKAKLSYLNTLYSLDNKSSIPHPRNTKNYTNDNKLDSRTIRNLSKTYTLEFNYSGADDDLNVKLGIFLDLCAENGITEVLSSRTTTYTFWTSTYLLP